MATPTTTHHRSFSAAAAALLLGSLVTAALAGQGSVDDRPREPDAGVRLITLDPGHFHAALIQRDMYPGVSETVHVFAPLGPDLIGHLNRIAQFNGRAERPTRWRLEIHTGADPLAEMLREPPGNVVVLSGRNRGKIDRILASVRAGLNVLADKPWIITSGDLPKLEQALDAAEQKGVVAYDVMTERYEITNLLQKELVNDPAVTGKVASGTEQEPGIDMESVHHLMKTVAGVPNLRPAWFFDTSQQGEGLADVGTHLVDLVTWMLFPNDLIDHRRDVRVLAAKRWPTVLSRADFQRVTNEKTWPASLSARVVDDRLQYDANTLVSYTLRGVHVRLNVRWDYEAPAGAGDTHRAVVRGETARIEVRQGPEQKYRPELYVVPASADRKPAVLAAVEKKLAALEPRFPGLAVEDAGAELHVTIPDHYRTGHESHFSEVTARFLEYLKAPASFPRWEKANMLAKYFVTTAGVELSRRTPAETTAGSGGTRPGGDRR